jgi:hypothetical protein
MGSIKNKYMLYIKIGVTFILTSIFVQSYAQSNGLNFQGVARNASGVILASQKIGLKFSIIANSETGTVEYIESRIVNTNAQGIFSVVIGDTAATNVVGNFTSINWKQIPKFLKVEMDPQGGTSFVNMGTTQLQKVPYAYYANGVNAANVDGILPVASGGTGVASISALKSTIGIDQINNTSDLSKPISTATQAALDLKANSADLSAKANSSDLAAKAPLVSPTFTGMVNGITKSMVGLSNVDNTSDLLKPLSTASINALNTKATATEVASALLQKENIANKSTSVVLGTSNDLYPTQNAVKAYVDAQINSGGVADNGITTVKIMDANITNAKLADNSVSTAKIIDGTIVNADINSTANISYSKLNLLGAILGSDISNTAAIPYSKLSITKADINGLGIPSNTDLITYTAGNGLTLTGSVFSIGNGAINTATIADASINTAKLADNSVSTTKIIDGTIVSADISNTAAIPFSKLNITKSDINGLGIPSNTDLTTYSAGNGLTLTGSVFSIGTGAITTTTIADGAISTSKLGDASINTVKLADNSVSTAKIIDGTIVSADISNTAAIPFSKLNITKSDINGLGIPSNTDLTTYSAGNGLALSGNTFTISNSVVTSNYTGTVALNGSSMIVDNNSIFVDGSSHKVGIGTNTPSSKLEINGSATNSTAYNANASTTIDFSQSNLAYTTASAGSFIINNIKDGGTYTLAVQGSTSGTSSFASSGFTFYSNNNGATTANKQTLYTFIVMGTKVYFYMTTGF